MHVGVDHWKIHYIELFKVEEEKKGHHCNNECWIKVEIIASCSEIASESIFGKK